MMVCQYLRPIRIAVLALSAALASPALVADSGKEAAEKKDAENFPPRAHAAWVYDLLNRPGLPRRFDPGYFADNINDYNRQAGKRHKIRGIYTFVGSTEMYCPGGEVSHCRPEHLVVTGLSGDRNEENLETLRAYSREFNSEYGGGPPLIIAVIDGVVNADYEGSMKGFNELPRELAEHLADEVSRAVCDNPKIAGVQFDIEPFDMSTRNGQYYFYRRISKNFATEVEGEGDDTVKCRNEDFPEGRFFSVFAVSHQLNPEAESARNVQSALNRYDNGYFVAPLYDLGSGPAGHALSVADYSQRAARHARQTREWAGKLGVRYKFAIPASASVHEFASCDGPACNEEEAEAERSQLAYTRAAIEAIDESGARQDPLFLGNAVWAFSRGIVHHDSQFRPNVPPADSKSYLADKL